MAPSRSRSPLVYGLALCCAGALLAAVLVVGPATPSAATAARVVTAAEGVVQATVSGTGNLEPASELDLGFRTAGTVSRIYVSADGHVTAGQLIAELEPRQGEVALEQARAALEGAEASLAQAEAGAEGSSTASTAATASAARPTTTARASIAAVVAPRAGTAPAGTGALPGRGTATGTPVPASGRSVAAQPSGSGSSSTGGRSSGAGTSTTSAQGSSGSGSSATTQSAASRAASVAGARATVRSDELAVRSAEVSLSDTRLYAPEAGTIVSLGGEVGETVAATGTTRAAQTSSSTGSSSAAASTSGARSAGASSGGSSSSSASSGGSTFAVLSDLSAMQLVVPVAESEISRVRAGQPATVTVEALEGRKLAAHVASVATLATDNSGVVSYDVTFALDQSASGLRPGMTAQAEVVVAQQEGVNVPTSAITADTVTVMRGGSEERRRVVTGLAGDSATIVLSGLHAGERVALPLSTTASGSSALSRLSRRGGAAGIAGGGLGGGAGFGFAARAAGG